MINQADSKTVLVADDDPSSLKLLQHLLAAQGLEVRTARNGYEALASVLNSPPDLLCLDAAMPAADGFTVCEVFALDEETSRIPVIVITARRDQQTIDRCRDMCAYYVNKSVHLKETLKSVVGELIEVEPSGRLMANRSGARPV